MSLLDFLKKPGVRKALLIGKATGRVLRNKLGNKLDQSDAKIIQKSSVSFTNELAKNLEQLNKFCQTPNAIGFIKVDFFSIQELEKKRDEPNLSPEKIEAFDEALIFLRECNVELEKIEVRKDGFIKGNLSKSLLEQGEGILRKAISRALEKTQKVGSREALRR